MKNWIDNLPKKLIADRLQSIREARSMTQQEVAELAGLSGGGIVCKFEKAQKTPSIGTLSRLAEALNVPLAFIVTPTVIENRHLELMLGLFDIMGKTPDSPHLETISSIIDIAKKE